MSCQSLKMYKIKLVLVLFFTIILVSDCQRRIEDGQKVTLPRPYVVYLTKARQSRVPYDNWICGGSIVSDDFVLTSAACVADVDFIYVIAGYDKYVPGEDIELNECTSKMKKKVIYTCYPTNYTFEPEKLDAWSQIDIALVKVESPFNFTDSEFETLCSYKPCSIAINYDEKYQTPGTNSIVMGWGHKKYWRKADDPHNYNQEFLLYAPTLLQNKSYCIERYKDYKNMETVIKKYMICSLGKGNLDEFGNVIVENLPIQNGCTSRQQKLLGFEGVSCEKEAEYSSYEDDETRRHNKESNQTRNKSLRDFNETVMRRSGICQNDHGGPLVAWVGVHEVVIGVASVFKVTKDYECMGPYLYTSTFSTGNFLSCILNSTFLDGRRRAQGECDLDAWERGYDTIERSISWKNHPAGAADNEK